MDKIVRKIMSRPQLLLKIFYVAMAVAIGLILLDWLQR
jgi:hypothetical protein